METDWGVQWQMNVHSWRLAAPEKYSLAYNLLPVKQ